MLMNMNLIYLQYSDIVLPEGKLVLHEYCRMQSRNPVLPAQRPAMDEAGCFHFSLLKIGYLCPDTGPASPERPAMDEAGGIHFGFLSTISA